MLLKIVWKNIWAKKLNSFLCILLMMFGISIISLLINIGNQLEDKFSKNISGIDMVVGAKGSPLQLILSGVYQIDAPTGNIPMSELQMLQTNPLVKEVLPISMGDNYMGFRVVGTTYPYLKHFEADYEVGGGFKENMEVVVGAGAAKKLGLKLNDTFASSHGLEKEGEAHGDQKYKVVGILKPNNSVIDNLILCYLNSIWEIHEHEEQHTNPIEIEPENTEAHQEEHDITCALIKFRSPLGLMTLPRLINQNTKMQAALPAIEINRLFELMGVGIDAFKALAIAIMLISGISVFVTLYNALKERKYEMALMLSMGGKRLKLFFMLMLEGLFLSLSGYFLGIILSRIGLWLTSNLLDQNLNFGLQQSILLKEEIYLLIAALLVGIFAAIIPSLGIYKINISKTLAND
ncbi:MAG TPA: ABC transporter permease [Leadbetterella sp.]|nr:ABC transporter permease [Leadbetterella sp.]